MRSVTDENKKEELKIKKEIIKNIADLSGKVPDIKNFDYIKIKQLKKAVADAKKIKKSSALQTAIKAYDELKSFY